MQNLKEYWKDVIEYEDTYEVSSLGNVRRKSDAIYHKSRRNKLLTPQKLKGYLAVDLCKNNKRERFTIHQLVGRAFNIIPKYGCFINHKDGNKHNNSVDNLELCTYSENNTHAYQTGLKPVNGKTTKYKGVSIKAKKRQRKDGTWWEASYYVAQITLNGKKHYIKQCTTELEAAKAYDQFIDDNNITTHFKNFA